MTDASLIDLLWEASASGATLRDEWLEEFVRHPEGVEHLRELIAEANPPTQLALANLLHEFADAPRRNAKKPRSKKECWRVLASYLHKEGPETWDAKFTHLPDADRHEDALELRPFAFSRRIGLNRKGAEVELVRCEFDSGKKPDEISWSTFEKYLKETKPR